MLMGQNIKFERRSLCELLRLPPTEFPRSQAPFASLKATARSKIVVVGMGILRQLEGPVVDRLHSNNIGLLDNNNFHNLPKKWEHN